MSRTAPLSPLFATTVAAAALTALSAGAPCVATAQTVRPAPNTEPVRYVVDNHGRDAGELTVRRTRDSIVVRYVFTDRNRGTRLEMRYRLNAGGAIVGGESRPVLADGSAGAATESFAIDGDSARFTTAGGRGATQANAVRVDPAHFVSLQGRTPWDNARLAKFLLARPNRTGTLLPSRAAATADIITRATASVRGRPTALRFVALNIGTQPTPAGVWIDEAGELFASDVQWFIPIRAGGEAALPKLRAAEIAWRNAEAEKLAASVRSKASADVVIRNGDVFDSERGVMVSRTTVVLRNDRVVAMGPAGSVQEPAGATIIDATGKTVMPGMWEMHAHLGLQAQNSGTLMQLTQGITTARDLAADTDVAVSIRDREAKGLLASPRYILGGFVEGPLKWAGPSAAIAATEAEARALVAMYDSLGYKQIKLYNVLHADIVPTIAAEAKKRGMRLSGHIPRGLSVKAAVQLGFDEVNHAAFLFSNFFQDSLYLPQMRAYSQVATAVAPTFNVDGPEMSDLIAFLRDRKTVIDGTFSIWIGGAAAAVGAGGSTDQQKADAAYLRLITRLHDAGVTLVPGTDQGGSTTFHRELALYQQAGIPAAEVLQIATIGSARVMNQEKEYGSIAVGKVADVTIVNGRPATNVADLSKVETVIRGGRIYEVSALRAALTGRPVP
jgi:imidazolonepropionase-like amidohydrolase